MVTGFEGQPIFLEKGEGFNFTDEVIKTLIAFNKSKLYQQNSTLQNRKILNPFKQFQRINNWTGIPWSDKLSSKFSNSFKLKCVYCRMNFRNPFKITKSSCRFFGFNLSWEEMKFIGKWNYFNPLLRVYTIYMVHTKCSIILESLLKVIASVKNLVMKFTKISNTLIAEELLEVNNFLIRA